MQVKKWDSKKMGFIDVLLMALDFDTSLYHNNINGNNFNFGLLK